MRHFYLCLLVFFALTTANSQTTHTWNGGNGAWNVAGNWTPNGVPGTNDIVQFNNGASQTVSGISSSVTLNKLVVTGNTNVTLQHTSGRTFTIANGTGTDFTVDAGSTLIMGNNINITLQNSATALIAGTLEVTDRSYTSDNNGNLTTVTGVIENSGGAVNGTTARLQFGSGSMYIHSRNGGDIPDATWDAASTCWLTGLTGGDPGGDGQDFGNLIYDSPGMTGNRNTGNGGLSVAGNLEIRNTGSAELRMSPNTLTVGGDFILNQGTFRIGSNTNRTINVNGNVSITGGTLLMSTGNNSSDMGTLNVAGNFSMSGGLINEDDDGTGYVNFNGAGVQVFSKTGGTISNSIDFAVLSGATLDLGGSVLNGSAGSFTLNTGAKIITSNSNGLRSSGASGSIQVTGTRTFSSGADYEFRGAVTGVFTTTPTASTARDIIINRAGAVTLSQPMAVTRNLKLMNGELTTSSVNLITVNNNATATDYSNASFVVGPILKKGNDDFEFPTGRTGAGLVPIRITGLSGSSDFRAEYKRASALTAGATISAAGLNHVSHCEYWTLDRTGSATANVTLYWNPSSNCNAAAYVDDLSSIVVAHSNGASWDAFSRNGGTTGNISSGTVTWNNVSTFSPFSLGSISGILNPLPIVLYNEKAYQKNNGMQVQWSNLTEKEILQYVVQRSANGTDFTDITVQSPKSNQHDRADYSIFDDSPVQGINFYRIKIKETTGRYAYSKLLRVEPGRIGAELRIYPNPVVNRQLHISLAGIQPGKYQVEIINAGGQTQFRKSLSVPGNAISENLVLPNSIKSGMNVLVIRGIDYHESKVFIVK